MASQEMSEPVHSGRTTERQTFATQISWQVGLQGWGVEKWTTYLEAGDVQQNMFVLWSFGSWDCCGDWHHQLVIIIDHKAFLIDQHLFAKTISKLYESQAAWAALKRESATRNQWNGGRERNNIRRLDMKSPPHVPDASWSPTDPWEGMRWQKNRAIKRTSIAFRSTPASRSCTFEGAWWCSHAWTSWTSGQGLCSSFQASPYMKWSPTEMSFWCSYMFILMKCSFYPASAHISTGSSCISFVSCTFYITRKNQNVPNMHVTVIPCNLATIPRNESKDQGTSDSCSR